MKTPRILLFALVAAFGLPGSTSAAEGDIPRYLLVWDDASLYTLPTKAAPKLRIFGWPAARRAEHPGQVRWVELVAETGEFYEVLTRDTLYADGQCYGPVPGLWAYEVHLFVHRDDVALATTEAVEVTHPDGTGVKLKPGVALLPVSGKGKRAHYLVAVDSLYFEATIPATAVGTIFRPDAEAWLGQWQPTTLDEAAPMWFGDGTAVRRYDEWGMQRPTTTAEHARGALITLVGGCSEYRVAVRSEDLTQTVGGGGLAALLGTMGGGVGDEREVRVAAVDTALYFPDGRRAGQMGNEMVYFEGDLVAFDGAGTPLLCAAVIAGAGEAHFTSTAERTLQVCFHSEDLAVETRGGYGFLEGVLGDGEMRNIDDRLEEVSGVEVGGKPE